MNFDSKSSWFEEKSLFLKRYTSRLSTPTCLIKMQCPFKSQNSCNKTEKLSSLQGQHLV